MHIDEFNEFIEDFINETGDDEPFTAQKATIEDCLRKEHEYFQLIANDELVEKGAYTMPMKKDQE